MIYAALRREFWHLKNSTILTVDVVVRPAFSLDRRSIQLQKHLDKRFLWVLRVPVTH